MRVIPEDPTEKKKRRLRRDKRIVPKVAATIEPKDKQAMALQVIGEEIKKLIEANTQNAGILLKIIRKVKTDVQLVLPEQPVQEKQVRKWKHTSMGRDSYNNLTIISEAVE